MVADQLQLRPIEAGEISGFVRAVGTAFGSLPPDDEMAFWESITRPDQCLAVFDGGRIVATAAWDGYELTLPPGQAAGCPVVAVPGVTAVGVHPTHRRRGLLTRMMARQLVDLRARGHVIAILCASESVIYGRFGYGLAQSFHDVAIASRRAAFRQAVAAGGRIRMTEPDEAAKVLPDIHERARRCQPGELNRMPEWWDWHFRDAEKGRDGGEARFYAVHESDGGEPDGFVSYRYHKSWRDGLADHRVAVGDLVAADSVVKAALWRFVLDLDLVGEVTCSPRPVDDPLRWLLADPRQLRTVGVGDHTWVRVLDVPGALAARGYQAEDRLVLEIEAPDPDGAGRWLLETGRDGASCRRARRTDKTDVVLGLADLGAIYLGGVAPSALAAAGRVTAAHAGVLARADAVFASPVAPFCSVEF